MLPPAQPVFLQELIAMDLGIESGFHRLEVRPLYQRAGGLRHEIGHDILRFNFPRIIPGRQGEIDIVPRNDLVEAKAFAHHQVVADHLAPRNVELQIS